MKKLIVSIVAAIAVTLGAVQVRACDQTCCAPTSCQKTNKIVKFVIKRTPMSEILVTQVAPASPNITTNFIREQVVVQPVVVRQVVVQEPVVVSQPAYVERVYHTPGRIGFVNLPLVASVGVSIGSYPSYYDTGTYWQYDSARQERYNMRANSAAYRSMFGGRSHYSSGPNYNNNPHGSRPPVGDAYGYRGRH